MRNLVSTYVDQFRQDRQKQLKLAAILAALAVVVAGVVFWQLHNTGVAMTNEVFCGQEEHVHDDGCYEQVLICDNEEVDHVHDDGCYETVLTCQIPEHTHTIECMTDDTADVETADVWEATLPALSGNWSEDVAAIAESQLGYTESTANFVLADDGETHMGYTRYGAWYGNAYGDWDAMFASFCLNYANVPASVVAESSGAYALAASLDQTGLYIDSADFTPAAGDLVFFDENGNGQADRVGIIVNAGNNEMTVVEGNSEDAVAENTYAINDFGILAFGILPDQGTPDGTENIEGDLVFAANDGGVYVSVTAPADALPEGAELSVTLIDEDSSDYAEAADAIGLNVQTLSTDDEETGMAALDICFLKDGVEVEPAEPVTVSIDAGAILPDGAENIVIRHLEETDTGVVPVLMAELDAASPVAEFEVESFSVFTVEWNDGTGTTIEVHVYNVNGTSINETLDEESDLIASNGTISISELVDHLQNNSSLSVEYTYQYATVIYETTLGGPGYSSDTIGNADNSVVSISKNGTNYTVRLANGTETVSDPALIKINLYYSLPTITLSTEDPYSDTVSFTVNSEYFQHDQDAGASVSYAWALSDDSAGTLTHEREGEATFVWDTDAQAGDQVTITVTKTVTYTDSEGNEQRETASDTYTLTYGEDPITITVRTQNGTLQADAHVALLDADGNTVATGTTDANGQVTLYVPDGGTYTVGVTYCVADSSGMGGGSTSRYTAEGTVTISADGTVVAGDTTVYLGTAIVSGPGGNTSGIYGGAIDGVYYYEHVDVKVAAASTEGTSVSFSDLDAVYVYDKYGNLIYVSEDLEQNPETGDYNCLFDINGDEDQHSIVVSSEDTIVIVYEVEDADGNYSTYTATYTSGGTYPNGEYYSYTDVNAYQLYNYKYGTSLSEAQFLEMAEAGTLEDYNENGIDIGGMGYTEVADCLCDTRTITGQAGLDFVIDVQEIEDIFGEYDFRVAKTLEDDSHIYDPSDIESFTFELLEIYSLEDAGDYTEAIWSATEGNTSDKFTGSTSAESWTRGDDGNWNAVIDFNGALLYEAQDGTYFYYYILSEQSPQTAYTEQQYYGLKVTVTYSSSSGVATVIASYCTLEVYDEDTYYRTSAWTGLTAQTDTDPDTGEDYTYFAVPFINTYDVDYYPLDIYKYSGGAGTVEVNSIGNYYLFRTDNAGNKQCMTNYSSDAVYVYSSIIWADAESEGVSPEAVTVYGGDSTLTFSALESGYDYYLTTDPSDADESARIYVTLDSNALDSLEGAVFTLSKTVTEIDETTEEESEVTYYAYFEFHQADGDTYQEDTYVFIGWVTEDEISGLPDNVYLTSGSDGYIHIKEMESGTYTLTETAAPEDYAKLTNSIEVVVHDSNANDGVVLIEIENIKASQLPNTGGIGTWLYTAAGLVLIGGAASLLIYRKRRAV